MPGACAGALALADACMAAGQEDAGKADRGQWAGGAPPDVADGRCDVGWEGGTADSDDEDDACSLEGFDSDGSEGEQGGWASGGEDCGGTERLGGGRARG